jgi:D-glycero-D-manno-heptose 1,7-bisphosphate phosphatase
MTASTYLLDGLGLWAEIRGAPLAVPGPMLLLDRDGVVNADIGYVGASDEVAILPGVAEALAACNHMGVPVAVVTNQSGIARGRFGWDGFAEVQRTIDLALGRAGAHIDAIFACAYHDIGAGALAIANHPWRKLRPGMLNLALDMFNARRDKSAMIGDKLSDMEAASAASLDLRFLVASDASPPALQGAGIVPFINPAEAIEAFLSTLPQTGTGKILSKPETDFVFSKPA